MVYQRNDVWENDSEVYSESQVYEVLQRAGVDVEYDTATDFVCLCPFHGNSHSPAFVVSKEKGLYFCNNPACHSAGTLEFLLQNLMSLNPFEAKRVILRARTDGGKSFEERYAKVTQDAGVFVEYKDIDIDRLAENLWPDSEGLAYLRKRGFEDDTLRHFGVGYSAKKNMVTVPMHDPTGKIRVGFIGRTASDTDKNFWNTPKLPKKETSWNFHRARAAGGTVIIVEASFDAMRVHQAGYANVVALLGGSLSGWQIDQITKQFDSVVIMTDFDNKRIDVNCRRCPGSCIGHRAGMELGKRIARDIPKRVSWASYGQGLYFPEGCKDVGDMTDDQIRACLRNPVSNSEFSSWGLD